MLDKGRVKKSVLSWLQNDPDAFWTIDELARGLHLEAAEVDEAMRELVAEGLVVDEGALWGSPFYVAYPNFYRLKERPSGEALAQQDVISSAWLQS